MAEQTPWEAMFIGGPMGHDTWEIGPEGGPPVGTANTEESANLIAAAPDLLAACEEALDLMGDMDLGHLLVFRQVEAAIAKARGEEVSA